MNQAVIASLIDELGVRPAELVVRGWLKNLAAPVFESEQNLLDAIISGNCKIGIATNAAASESGLSVNIPQPAAVDIDGIGIGRHAQNPVGALALVEWLFADLPDLRPAEIDERRQKNVGLVAWYEDDVVKLAERAQYR